MLDALRIIATALGTITIVGGSAVGLAYLAFRMYGEKWMASQFDKQLERFKHEQQKEIEHLRYRINAVFDRAVRLHAMEFEVLPEIWKRLFDAYHEAERFTNHGRMVHDINKMKPAELEAFLNGSPLQDYQKQEVREANDKSASYYNIEHYHERGRVKKTYYTYTEYYMKNAIFLTPEVEKQCDEMRDIMFAAISEKEFRHDYGKELGALEHDKHDLLRKRGKELMDELRLVVREHLQDSKRQMLA